MLPNALHLSALQWIDAQQRQRHEVIQKFGTMYERLLRQGLVEELGMPSRQERSRKVNAAERILTSIAGEDVPDVVYRNIPDPRNPVFITEAGRSVLHGREARFRG